VSEGRHTGAWILGAVAAAAAIGLAVWRLDAPAPMPPEAPAAQAAPEPIATPTTPEATPELPLEPSAASYRIAERGRIAISSATFEPGVPVALDLDLPDDVRGVDARPVRIAAVDGRLLRTTASLLAEPGSGVRLELEPDWLLPGRYLIEVTTAEKVHFPTRRYVLEVR
jgi:hypothetical protein